MDSSTTAGPPQLIDGELRVYCLGYWIKAYDVPEDTLGAKKRLIDALTRRLFNHVEHGLNIPGTRLDEARHAYDSEPDPERRRVKGAMLAGALFNRATDIFTKLVEIQALGVHIEPSNALMGECGGYLQEALALGKLVLHRSGEEGIDELWGEPLKAFAFPVDEFYKSRYVKIAQTMRDIDRIRDELIAVLDGTAMFAGIASLLREFAKTARTKSETLRTDPDVFDVWTSFVVAGERLTAFEPRLSNTPSPEERQRASHGMQLVAQGKALVVSITRARVPMPKTTREFVERCQAYHGASAFGARHQSASH